LLWAVFGFVVAQLLGAVFGEVAGVIAGKTSAQMTAIVHANAPPEWYVVSSLAGIWVGFVGAPWVASRTAGTRRFLRDIGLRFRWIDLPFGVAVGVVGQLAIAALYAPFQHDIHNYDAPTQKITGGSHGGGVLLIVVATALLAPFAEEVFFRGVLFKGLLRVFGVGGVGRVGEVGGGVAGGSALVSAGTRRVVAVAVAVVIDGLLFGLAHAEWVQLAGLALFGMVLAVVSYRTGRLGMNIVAHASFNMFAVLAYLYGVVH
jgi:membrane protease YdiL (CAAX protease family)